MYQHPLEKTQTEPRTESLVLWVGHRVKEPSEPDLAPVLSVFVPVRHDGPRSGRGGPVLAWGWGLGRVLSETLSGPDTKRTSGRIGWGVTGVYYKGQQSL